MKRKRNKGRTRKSEMDHFANARYEQPDRFFPSRFWSKQIKEYEAEQRAAGTPGYEKR